MNKTEEKLMQIKDAALRTKCLKILNHLEKKYSFSEKPAAKNHHHNYRGGLDVHTAEVMAQILQLNLIAGNDSSNPFSNDEVLLVGFLHDLGKAYAYVFAHNIDTKQEEIRLISFPCSQEAIIFRLCAKFGIELSFEQMSAIEFAHGGWSVQAQNNHIERGKLADLLHCADLLSAGFGVAKK